MTTDWQRDREACEAATSGPWWVSETDGCVIAGPFGGFDVDVGDCDWRDKDVEFALRARTRWPAALDEIDSLRAELERVTGERDEARRIASSALDIAHERTTVLGSGEYGAINRLRGELTMPAPKDDPYFRGYADGKRTAQWTDAERDAAIARAEAAEREVERLKTLPQSIWNETTWRQEHEQTKRETAEAIAAWLRDKASEYEDGSYTQCEIDELAADIRAGLWRTK